MSRTSVDLKLVGVVPLRFLGSRDLAVFVDRFGRTFDGLRDMFEVVRHR